MSVGRGRVFAATVVGCLLLHLAWILAVPVAWGIDEFDHVYKADAVAHGQLLGTAQAPEGRGQLLPVDRTTLEAVAPTCRARDYTEPDDCRAVQVLDDDRVLVGSAAASYNPAYYAVVGQVTHVLDGSAAVLAMRLLTAVLCAVLLGLAAAVTAGWARTRVPLVALAVACTPVLVYSGSIVSPNGVGYAAGALWWACALGVVTGRVSHWTLLTLASVLLLVTHTTNLLWLPVMVATVLLARPLRQWVAVVRDERGARIAAAVVTLVGVACLSWSRLADTNELPADAITTSGPSTASVAAVWPSWLLGGIGAFPMRDEPAPLLVYAAWALALGTVLALGALASTAPVRRAALLATTTWLVVPVVLTLATYDRLGFAWQGRYALPLALGLPALAGLAVDSGRVPWPSRLVDQLVTAALVAVALGHVVSVAAVALRTSGSGSGLAWTFVDRVPGGPLLGVAGCVALASAGAGVAAAGRARPRTPVTSRAGAAAS